MMQYAGICFVTRSFKYIINAVIPFFHRENYRRKCSRLFGYGSPVVVSLITDNLQTNMNVHKLRIALRSMMITPENLEGDFCDPSKTE